jgi:hypothetical protein
VINAYAFAETFHETHQTLVKMNVQDYMRLSWEDLPGAARHALLATTKYMIPAVDAAYAATITGFILALQERPELWQTFIHLARTRDAENIQRGILGFIQDQRARDQAGGQ